MKINTTLTSIIATITLYLFCGCATIQTLSIEQQRDIQKKTVSILGENSKVTVISIPSRGAAADATFIAQSKSIGPSLIAKQVASYFASSTNESMDIALVGPNSSKTTQVINDALDLNKSNDLSQLTIVFFGESTDRAPIENKANSLGARYIIEDYQHP